MSRYAVRALASALLFALPALPALAQTPEGVLSKLKASLSGVVDLSAEFTQTTMLEAAGMEKKVGGKVKIKRGAKMLWEYDGSDPQKIVGDGKTVWVWQVRDRTVIRKEMAEMSPAARTALDLIGGVLEVEKHFAVSSCGPSCVEMKPRSPDPDLSLIRLETVDEGAGLKAVVTEDSVGNRTRIELKNVEKNRGLADSIFDFVPPRGVDVFDGQGRQR